MDYMNTQTKQLTLTLDELRNGPPTISVERAGQYLGVSRAFAYAMAREGRLPTIKLGPRRVRVPSAALVRMLTGEEVSPP